MKYEISYKISFPSHIITNSNDWFWLKMFSNYNDYEEARKTACRGRKKETKQIRMDALWRQRNVNLCFLFLFLEMKRTHKRLVASRNILTKKISDVRQLVARCFNDGFCFYLLCYSIQSIIICIFGMNFNVGFKYL